MDPVRKRAVLVGVLAVLVLLAGVLVARRHQVIAALLPRVISSATGYDVTIGSERIGTTHAALIDVRVAKDGDPVLEARRIDVWYSVRDLLPGSRHRYGVNAITIDHPRFAIIRHKDGSYNITFPRAGPGPIAAPRYPNRVPIRLSIRIRNGSGTLRAPYALDPQSRSIAIEDLALDATVDTSGRTHYVLHGAFAEPQLEPFTALGTVDYARGYAMHHAFASAVPMRAIANYFIDSDAARVLAGTATNLDVRVYALNVQRYQPVHYHLSGALDVSNARMHIIGLAQPLQSIDGHLQIVDDAFFSNALRARLAGVPVRVTGGIFDFAAPQYRLGIVAHGDLSRLRHTFAFASSEPINGAAAVRVVVQGALDAPMVLARVDAGMAVYRGFRLRNVHASLAYHDAALDIAPLHAQLHGAALTLRGALALGSFVHSQLALHVTGPAGAMPYVGELLHDEPLVADVILDGRDLAFAGYGALASARGIDRAAALVRVARGGVIDVAPMWFRTAGGTLAGAYHLDRATDTSAFWIEGRHLQLRAPAANAAIANALPDLPPIDGVVDAVSLEGGGRSGAAAIAGGALHAHALTVAGVRFDRLHARFAGTLANAAMDPVDASGPWGAIDGTGELSLHSIAVRGHYRGTLQGLRPYLADPTAAGRVDGTAAFAIAPTGVTIQADALALHGAVVHGLPIAALRGTFGAHNGEVRVYAATGVVAGGDVVAGGSYAHGVTFVAAHLHGSGLRALGLPLQRGTVSARGTVTAGASLPQFSGGVSVADGKAGPYDVAGSAIVAMRGASARLTHVVAALDGTYAFASGDISQLTSGSPAYALDTRIPAGDVTRALQTLSLPTYSSDGTYAASLAVRGRGLDPHAAGPVNVAAGSVNGLDFTDARAMLTASRAGAIARHGGVQVGTTHVTFAAGENPRISGVLVRSSRADLADFNNFFDTGDTLAGNGAFRFDVVSQAHRLSTNGDVNIRGFRYRNLPIGDTRANWSSAHNDLKGSLAVGGNHGRLRASGEILFAPSNRWWSVLRNSTYHVKLDFDRVDASTWVAALGFPQIPLTGSVAANGTVAGRYPSLTATGTATLTHGTVWRLPIEEADLAFTSLGKRVRIDSASVVAPGITAAATGSLGLTPRAPVNVDVYLNSQDVPQLSAQLFRRTVPITGAFESTVSIRGTLGNPAFSAAFDATDASLYGVSVPSIFGSLVWNRAKDSLELRSAGAQFTRGALSLAGSLPLRLQPFGIGPSGAPISFDVALDGVDPGNFDALFGHHTQASGAIDGAFAIGGVVGDPRIAGRFRLVNGSYTSDFDTTPITNASASLTFDRTHATVDRAFARLGAGTLDAAGTASFIHGTSFHITARASNAQLSIPALGTGQLDGAVALDQAAHHDAILGGTVTLHDATIPFSAFLAAARGTGGAGGGAGAVPVPVNLGLDLHLAAGRNVRVRGAGYGAGLDIGAVGAVTLAGTAGAPTLAGRFTATNGTLTYFDRAFRVQSASVAFQPSQGIVPTLRAIGVTHVSNPDPRSGYGSTDVTIQVTGPINDLNVAFSSDPPGYSNEQILAMIAPFSSLLGGVAYAPGYTATINGITPYGALNPVPGARAIGTTSAPGTIGQEAFNLLNTQFTAGVLTNVESALSQSLGLSDLNLNVDYYGNVGLSVTRLLGKTVNFIYSQSFGIPARYTAGLQLVGRRSTSAQLSFFWTTGPQQLFATPAGTVSSSGRILVGEPLAGQSGFSFTLQRLYW